MKPTSVISIIVAFLLIVAGLITCFVAQNIASASGDFIFAESRGDDLVNTVEIGQDISKIELIVQNAEINIFGTSDKSYIEFVNFSENYYSLSQSNTIISFDEIPDLKSMLKFWENGFSFKGMRYILNFNKQSDNAEKVINVYLKADQLLKIFDIQANICTVNINEIEIDCDYKINANDISINASTLKTGGTLNINSGDKEEAANKVSMNISYSLIKNLNISSKELITDIDLFKLSGNSNITCDSGDISFKFITDPTLMNLDIKTDGYLTVAGNDYMSSYVHAGNPDSQYSMKISSKNADISISKASTPATQAQNNE